MHDEKQKRKTKQKQNDDYRRFWIKSFSFHLTRSIVTTIVS